MQSNQMYYRCMWPEFVVGDCGVREEVVHYWTEWKERQCLHRCRLGEKGKRSQTMLALERANELERKKTKKQQDESESDAEILLRSE